MCALKTVIPVGMGQRDPYFPQSILQMLRLVPFLSYGVELLRQLPLMQDQVQCILIHRYIKFEIPYRYRYIYVENKNLPSIAVS